LPKQKQRWRGKTSSTKNRGRKKNDYVKIQLTPKRSPENLRTGVRTRRTFTSDERQEVYDQERRERQRIDDKRKAHELAFEAESEENKELVRIIKDGNMRKVMKIWDESFDAYNGEIIREIIEGKSGRIAERLRSDSHDFSSLMEQYKERELVENERREKAMRDYLAQEKEDSDSEDYMY
jgi:hypothetical protein